MSDRTGEPLLAFAGELFPFHRTIAGPGVRQTFAAIEKRIPLTIHGVESGSDVFGWTIPAEWSITDAYVKDASDRRIIDYRKSNLHVVSYSVPVTGTFTWAELKPHLHTLPDQPGLIPYRTGHFSEQWGFCLTHELYRGMEARSAAEYEVLIDSKLTAGQLSWAECVVPGVRDEQILISTHVCHPSLANDNTAAIAIATAAAERLQRAGDLPWTYRFLFVPATIGAIAWLHSNRSNVASIRGGLVLSTLGDKGPITYKRSRRGDANVDRAAVAVLDRRGDPYSVREFSPIGYDERQFCSPGFNLPVGGLMRTPHGEYPEYHTSADDLSLLSGDAMADSLEVLLEILLSPDLGDENEAAPAAVDAIATPLRREAAGAEVQTRTVRAENRLLNLQPFGEPPLGKYGLYQRHGEVADPQLQKAILWVLNFSDGNHCLNEVSSRSAIPLQTVIDAATRLVACGLLAEID